MSRLQRWLADEAGRQQPSELPPFELIAERASRRKRRAGVVAISAAGCAVLLIALGAIWVADSGRQSSSTVQSPASPLSTPSYPASPISPAASRPARTSSPSDATCGWSGELVSLPAYAGLTLAAAEAQAAKEGRDFQVVGEDGQCTAAAQNQLLILKYNRVSVYLRHGVVEWAQLF